MTISALIFDMDGLLLDSERRCLECFLSAAQEIGYKVKKDVYLRCIGANVERTRQILCEGHGSNFPYEQLRKRWDALYHQSITEEALPIKTGVVELLEEAKSRGLALAVATSTAYPLANLKLKNAGLLHYFSHIVSGDQVEKSKPNPDIYLRAVELLGENVKHCLAFEDSENGLLAAHLAGIKVIQVPDLIEASSEVRALAHEIKETLLAVDLNQYCKQL